MFDVSELHCHLEINLSESWASNESAKVCLRKSLTQIVYDQMCKGSQKIKEIIRENNA